VVINGGLTVISTLTVTGNAFSVGGSTFVVSGGSVTIGGETPVEIFSIQGHNVKPTIGIASHTVIQSGYDGFDVTALEIAGTGNATTAIGMLVLSSSMTAATRIMGGINFTARSAPTISKNSAIIYSSLDSVATSSVTGNIRFHTSFESTMAERMRITGSGTVGIGNTAPSARLDVTGGITASAIVFSSGTMTVTGLPASAGAGGLYVCVDSNGVFYKKSSCP
jgi:hypothetical protein